MLQEVAAITGGEYKFADTSNIVGIVGSFLYAQVSSTSKVLREHQGTISEGEIKRVKPFSVPDDVGDLNGTLYWPGSFLDFILIDPNGQEVDEDYPNAVIDESSIPSNITVKDPLPGKWEIEIEGVETSQDDEPYYVITSFKRSDDKSETSLETMEIAGACCLPIGFFGIIVFGMLLVFVNSRKYKS
jgi:hypothetical protein